MGRGEGKGGERGSWGNSTLVVGGIDAPGDDDDDDDDDAILQRGCRKLV